ncbi:MAG TPA: AAA family ATPase [Candidatus Binatia bacterium]|nr:AAA family ATPase [Candidatus Binatia bacterium]
MTPRPQAIFPPFHLDLESGQLFHGTRVIPLRPKTFAVLRHLLERAGRLVTREELVSAVWRDAHGSETLPKGCVRELREALGDRVAAPRFIESVGRRGYRFVAPLTYADGPERSSATAAELRRSLRVGREAELAALLRALERARSGERQVVFVTGEPGIGKTTLVEAFLRHVGDAAVAHGQCVEQYGAGEAYLPVLDAIGRLCREAGGADVVAVLDRYAPTWLLQLPALVEPAELAALERRLAGASRERMLREITEAIDVLARERLLVLVLEDLHWSDPSTVELVAALARRRDAARLLLLGTHRPADLIVRAHPLRAIERELAARAESEELALGLLTRAEVARYLDARFPAHDFSADVSSAVHRATDGNPLFMVNAVDDLVARRAIVEASGRWRLACTVDEVARNVPESLRQLIEQHAARLQREERRVLEAASVAGSEFAAAAVAAAMELDPAWVEECCDALARSGRFLRAAGAVGRYEFLHALYPAVFYDRLPAGRRVELHRRVGEAEEALHGEHAADVAAQLAVHFERAHDPARAARFLQQAAENALRRYAPHEAVTHLTRATALLRGLPETLERTTQELRVQMTLGGAFMATEGYASAEVERAYARARAIGARLGDVPEIFPMLRGLQRFSLVRARVAAAADLAARCRRIAERSRDPTLRVEAYLARGETACYAGGLRRATALLARARILCDARPPGLGALPWDPRVGCRYHQALVLWLRGRPDAAARQMEEARALAETSDHPFAVTYACCGSAFIHQLRREPDEVERWADAGLRNATEHGFKNFAALCPIFLGWVRAVRGRPDGLEAMHRGRAALQATASALMDPYWLALLAEASGRAGRAAEGLRLIARARALSERTGERWCLPELHRIAGELLVADGALARAGRALATAIAAARRHGAVAFELRAATSLARLWRQACRASKARHALARAYRRLGDGHDTPDARDARLLLAAGAGGATASEGRRRARAAAAKSGRPPRVAPGLLPAASSRSRRRRAARTPRPR